MITRGTLRVASGGVLGGIVGVLMRPCCVIPASLSLLGFTGAATADTVIAYRPVLFAISLTLLAGSLWLTFRTRGGWPVKIISASATILAFVFFGSF